MLERMSNDASSLRAACFTSAQQLAPFLVPEYYWHDINAPIPVYYSLIDGNELILCPKAGSIEWFHLASGRLSSCRQEVENIS